MNNIIDEEKIYWKNKLDKDFIMTSFQLDKIKQHVKLYSEDELVYTFSDKAYENIQMISNKSDYSAYVIFTAAVQYMLFKYNSTEDINIGITEFKQKSSDENKIIPLNNVVNKEFTIKELLVSVQKGIQECIKHSSIKYEDILKLLEMNTDDENLKIKTMVIYENIQNVPSCQSDIKFIFSKDNNLKLSIKYNSELYTKEFINQLFNELNRFIELIMENREESLKNIEIVTESEKSKLLKDFNDNNADYPRNKTINDIFQEICERYKDKDALTLNNKSITYEELNKRVNMLASFLRKTGVGKETIVSIMIEPSFEQIIGMLAILKAGGAYLPIDIEYPQSRIEYTLSDSKTKFLLINNNFNRDIEFDGKIINIEESSIYEGDQVKIDNINSPEDLAYIIYTSGTTGKPKGVMIQHNNLIRLLINTKMQFDFSSDDVWTMFHSFCFDFSVWEMYGALLYGGRLVLIPRIHAKDTKTFLKILKEEKVTILNQTPTAFNSLSNEESNQIKHELNVRYIIFGGEALKPVILKSWKERYPDTKLINMYGITETTVHVTYKEITDYEINNNISNIGKPIPTLKVYIMDENLKLSPIGAVGEICVSGDGVGRGYLNKPQLTEEKFINNHYNSNERMYRTGDLGKLLQNGEIEYIGRRDMQVKIRGFRIEIGEIEANLLRYNKIKEAVVIARDNGEEKDLCAYIVSDEEISVAEIRNFLSTTLPQYMIPSYFIKIDKIPMTSNGKLDKKNLPEPLNNFISNNEYIGPKNAIEKTLVDIFTDELHINDREIGVNEDFFELGGDSIKALKIVNRINKSLNVKVEISTLYKYSKLIDMAEYISQNSKKIQEKQNYDYKKYDEQFKEKILKENINYFNLEEVEDFYELSDIQFGMIYHSLNESNSSMYHDQFLYQLNIKNFDYNKILRSLELMIQKHSILRVNYDLIHFSNPIQIVFKEIEPFLEYEDISSLPLVSQEEKVKEYIQNDKKNKFNLENISKEPLWRIKLFDLGEDNITLVWSFHHSILDGWSCSVFISELFRFYKQICEGEDIKLNKLKYSYKEFILNQKELKENKELYEYWQNQLIDYKKFSVTKNTEKEPVSKCVYYDLPKELIEKLHDINKNYKTDFKTIYFAAYLYMLNMISYETDLTVGLVEHNRPICEDADKILGCFLNTIPVRMNFEKDITCEELINIIKNKLIDTKYYGRIPLVDIINCLDKDNSEDNGIFETIFNYIDFYVLDDNNEYVSPSEKLNIDNYEKTNTIFDFTVSNTLNNYQVKITYRTCDFKENEISNLFNYFVNVLNMFVNKPKGILTKEEILSTSEKTELLYDLNMTDYNFNSDKFVIQEFFEEQVNKNPENTAVIFKDSIMTYKELNEKSNQLARKLRNKGIGRDSIVGMMVDRSFEMVIGIFAIIKAGGAYLPIDKAYPQERISYIMNDSNVKILLSDEDLKIEGFKNDVINISDESLYTGDSSNLPIINEENDLVYVIYTSGSTGKPKGTLLHHKGLINRLSWMQRRYPLSSEDTILQKTTYTFDVSVWELIWWSMVGAKVCMLVSNGEKDPEVIIKTIEKNNITVMHFVPSMFSIFLQYIEHGKDTKKVSSLKRIFCSGEALQSNQVNKFNKIFKDESVELTNLYGPTEATIDVSYFDCMKNETYDLIPIGKPIDNTKFYIVNKKGELQPKGTYGELCVSGVNLARGYLNKPELTEAKFIKNKFDKVSRIYKTGDFARWLSDGNIEYIARIDNQVKIRGLRIELGEIESDILDYSHVKEAAVDAKKFDNGQTYLCAYLCCEDEIYINKLKEYLEKRLPKYMVPDYYVFLDKMPLSHNGKLDKKALPIPQQSNTQIDNNYIAPESEVEKQLEEIWRDILKVDRISVDENIFDLGAHSLVVAIIILKINEKLKLNLKIRDLYTYQSIKEMAEYIQGLNEVAATSMSHRDISKCEASPAQKRLFIMNEIEGDNFVYNMPYGFKISGDLNKEKLEKAFNDVIIRQQSLRTTFEFEDGVLYQKINNDIDFKIDYIQLEDKKIDEIVKQFVRRFNLEEDLLIRVKLIKVKEKEHILLVDMHHIIADGMSIDILFNDLFKLYYGQSLEPLKLQYIDYSAYYNELLNNKDIINKQEKYWMDIFSGYTPELNIPRDFEDGKMDFSKGEKVVSIIEGELLEKIRKIGKDYSTTMYSLLFSAYYILLKEFTNKDDLAIGTGISGRNDINLQNVIGMFLNTFSIRNSPKDDKKISEFLAEVTESLLGAYDNQDYPFEDLVKKLNITRKPGSIPLQETIFIYRKLEEESLKINDLNIELYDLGLNIVKNDIYITCIDKENSIEVYFEYASSYFKESTIKKLSERYKEILIIIADNIEETIGNICISNNATSSESDYSEDISFDF